MKWLVVCLTLALVGCALKLGPGEGWVKISIWEQANLSAETPLGDICIGCLEVQPEEEGSSDSE